MSSAFKSAAEASDAPADDERSCLVVRGATVIDGNGGPPLRDGVVIIKGRRIAAVGGPQTSAPDGSRVIDGHGRFVIPGLMDASVHLVLDYFPVNLIRHEGCLDQLAIEAAQVALKQGVTTVFDTWGPRDALIEARRKISSGRAAGARLFLCGNILGLNGPFSEDFFPQARSVLFEEFSDRIDARWQEGVGRELMTMTPEAVGALAAEYCASGIDFVRYAASGHGAAVARYIALSPRVQQAIVGAARAAGLTSQCHSTSVQAVQMALEAGASILQQVSTTGIQKLPEELVEQLAAAQTPCAILPNTKLALDWYRARFGMTDPPGRAHVARQVADSSERALIAAGANLMLATDGGIVSSNTETSSFWRSFAPPKEICPFLLGEGHFHWLDAVAEKGMSPMDALLAATRNVARAYNLDGDLGTLEPGKLADLLILGGNPLDASANYRTIQMVIKDGQVVDRDALPKTRMLTGEAK